MDHQTLEQLKEQWFEIEDKDGLRFTWNTFPNTRMVCHVVDEAIVKGEIGKLIWFCLLA